MTTNMYVIRCQIIWASLAVTLLFVTSLLASLAVVEVHASSHDNLHNTREEGATENEHFITIGDLPSDGHLNSHNQDAFAASLSGGSGSGSTSTLFNTVANVDCTCRQHARNLWHQQPQQPQERGARIFYLILVHNLFTIRDALPLFRALRDERHTIVFHVDRKVHDSIASQNATAAPLRAALQRLQDELDSCPCGSRVHLESVHQVEWSHWSMNLPTLWGMQLATSQKYWQTWDVFINLSGDSLPVYSPATMARIFAKLPYNFVTSRSCETGLVPTNVYDFPSQWHKRIHYTNHDRDEPPLIEFTVNNTPQSTRVQYHFGSQWVALQPDFVQYVAQELDRPDSFPSRYRDHLVQQGKVMTDETFLPTILMHVHPFNTTLPKIIRDNKPDTFNNSTDPLSDGYVQYEGDNNNDNIDNANLPHVRTLRYERMDEHFPSALRGYFPTHPRYEVPKFSPPESPSSSSSSFQEMEIPPSPHIWGPYYLGVYDLADIKASGALLIRKTSTVIDPNLYHLLPVDAPHQIPPIQWPAIGIQVSPVPDWQAEKRHYMKKAYQRAKAKGQVIPPLVEQQMQELLQDNKDSVNDENSPEKTKDSTTLALQSARHDQRELIGTLVLPSSSTNNNRGGNKQDPPLLI